MASRGNITTQATEMRLDDPTEVPGELMKIKSGKCNIV